MYMAAALWKELFARAGGKQDEKRKVVQKRERNYIEWQPITCGVGNFAQPV